MKCGNLSMLLPDTYFAQEQFSFQISVVKFGHHVSRPLAREYSKII